MKDKNTYNITLPVLINALIEIGESFQKDHINPAKVSVLIPKNPSLPMSQGAECVPIRSLSVTSNEYMLGIVLCNVKNDEDP